MTLAYVNDNVRGMDAFLEQMRSQQALGQQRTLQIVAATGNAPTGRVQPEVDQLRRELEAARAREKIYAEQAQQAEGYIRGMRHQARSYQSHVEESAENLIHYEQSSFMEKAEEYKSMLRREYTQAWQADQQRAQEALGSLIEILQQESQIHQQELAEAVGAQCHQLRNESLTHAEQLENSNRQLRAEAELAPQEVRMEESELSYAQTSLSNAYRVQCEAEEQVRAARLHAAQHQQEAQAALAELHQRLQVPQEVPIFPMNSGNSTPYQESAPQSARTHRRASTHDSSAERSFHSVAVDAAQGKLVGDDHEDRKMQAMLTGITDRLQSHHRRGRPLKTKYERVYRTWDGRKNVRKRYRAKTKPGTEAELEDVYSDLPPPPAAPLFRFAKEDHLPWPSMSSSDARAPPVCYPAVPF